MRLVLRPTEENDKSSMLLTSAARLVAVAASMSPPTVFNVLDPFPLDEPDVGEVTFSTPLNPGTISRKANDIANESVIGGLREEHTSR